MHHIVIVGGGAGGLELATRLGRALPRRHARVTLVDCNPTHVWKPLLHEVAAGTLDIHAHQLDYLAQALWSGFGFCWGALEGIDRARRTISVGAVANPDGETLIPRRELAYDTLVLALGAETNDFGVPGVAEHAFKLDDVASAERLRLRLVETCVRLNHDAAGAERTVRVAIVGGGATGVELAAELHGASRVLAGYGLDRFDPARQLAITLINADPRILPMLPQRLSEASTHTLEGLGIAVLNAEQAIEVTADGVRLRSGRDVAADLTVWAAGVRGRPLAATLDGLETNRARQLLVRETLQTTLDERIFALGDCAACPWVGHTGSVPPRAQTANQQARYLARSLIAQLHHGHSPAAFRYRDFGSLVSLGEYSTVGSLMGSLSGPSLRVEGLFARIMYVSLYFKHRTALFGGLRASLDWLGRTLRSPTAPRVKLH